jgi:hypothetical protein
MFMKRSNKLKNLGKELSKFVFLKERSEKFCLNRKHQVHLSKRIVYQELNLFSKFKITRLNVIGFLFHIQS